jgi:hypothetical protein
MAERLLPDIVSLSASSLDTWLRCRREYLAGNVLGLPESDAGPPFEHGNFVHALLRHVHVTGSCRDDEHVADVLVAHGVDADGPYGQIIDRHRQRCPENVERAAHEHERARFHRRPAPMFMVTGRIDAIWVHHGILDARDYKTGRPFLDRVADDPRARLQAWLLAPYARRHDLRLHLRYEFLAPEVTEDPEPFEPDDDDLDQIGEELASMVRELWAERDFAGVADRETCSRCRYRSICRDSASPGVAMWPVVEPDLDDEEGADAGG